MNRAVVMIYRGNLSIDKKEEFYFKDDEDFKAQLLKRLGNVSVSNNLEKKRLKVKQVIYDNKKISELQKEIRVNTDWKIGIYLYIKRSVNHERNTHIKWY